MRPRRPSPALIVAILALVVALGGTAFAASRYLITSTSQIKPSVLNQIRNGPDAIPAAAVKGPKAVIDRVRVSNLAMSPGEEPITASGATWSQQAAQVNGLLGQVTVTVPPSSECPGGGSVSATLDGGGTFGIARFPSKSTESTGTYTFEWEAPGVSVAGGSSTWLVEPGVTTSHTLHVAGLNGCPAGVHPTIDSLSIDVLGFR